MDQQFAEILADDARKHDGDKNNDDHLDHQHRSEIEGEKLDGGYGEAEKKGDVTPSGRHGQQHRHRHGHDRLGAQSVGVELAEGPIDWGKFTAWLKGFLEKEGEELIWRLKGVLWTTTAPGQGSGAATTWGWGAGRRTVVQVRAGVVGDL